MRADGAFADTIWVTDGGSYYEACDFNNLDSCWMIGAPGTSPLVQYNGTDTVEIASWGGSRALMRHSNYTNATFSVRNFEICGISEADSTDTLSQLYWGGMSFYRCKIHDATGTVGQQRNGSGGTRYYLDSCEFYHSYTGPSAGTGTISYCVFRDFTRPASWMNPTGLYIGDNEVTVRNCVFFNNGGSSGQAIFMRDASDCVFKNNLFYNNYDVIRLFAAYGELNARNEWINNTIVYNEGDGLIIPGNQNWVIKNNILWGNDKGGGGGYDLAAGTDGKKGWDITYNIVGTYDSDLDSTFADTVFCVGNDSIDPMLADTTDSLNGFYLFYRSPAIDAGNPGILDPDNSRSDQGCFGGPWATMKAPKWLSYFGGVWQDTLPGAANDTVWWTRYGDPAGFDGYVVFHDTNTTSNLYAPRDSARIAKITTITDTALHSKHVDTTWYKVAAYCDSTGDTLGGGYTCMDTIIPYLTAAYYFTYGTSDPSDDELRLTFNEGIQPAGVDLNQPDHYIEIVGVGDFTGAVISSVNEFVISMGSAGASMAHNRSWVKVRTDSLEDFFGNKAITWGDSVEVQTFNVYNTDNGNSFESIGKAVQFASSGHYITILDNGYYDEEVTVDVTDLTIQADSAAHPRVDGEDFCFDIQADGVCIVNVVCTSAVKAAIRIAPDVSGAGIINDTVFNCAGDTGITVSGHNNTIRGNVVHNNAIGIHVSGDTNRVTNNTARNNTSHGIYVDAQYGEIRNNVAYANGGSGITANNANTNTTNNICLGNTTNPVQGTSTEANNTDDGTDPFTNAAGYDFTLTAGSAEWSAGENGENRGIYEGRVEQSGDGYATKYHTINAAYAASDSGDTVRCYYGNYYESLLLEGGHAITIIPNGTDSVFWRWDQVGINISGGTPYYSLADTSGVSVTVRNIIFANGDPNVPDDAYGGNYSSSIYLEKGTVTNCIFREGRTDRPDCGIIIRNEDTVAVDSCTFLTGGVDYQYCNSANRKTISYCYFDTASWGVDLQNSNRIILRNNTFEDVTVRFEDGGDHRIYNNLFWKARVDAQSTANDYDNPNIWINNTVYLDDAGGVHIEGVGDTLINNIFYGGDSTAIFVHETSVYAWYNIIDSVVPGDEGFFPSNQGNLVGGAAFEYPLWADTASLDFHLLYNSPAIDRGHPDYVDPDSGRSDIGCYGGTGADTAAPARLDTFVYVTLPGNKDSLHWGYAGGVPGDLDFYMIYRSTAPIFIPGAATVIGSVQAAGKHDTTFDNGGTAYYYRVSGVDTDLYGGGYVAFDTVRPFIDTAIYYCSGTPTFSDDTLKVVMSEWVLDSGLPDSAKNIFTIYGLGNIDTAMVHTGTVGNDDTLIITGFSQPLCKGRGWIGLADSTLQDYFENINENDSVKVGTYNVGLKSTGGHYNTITAAIAAAAPSDSIFVVDAGLYEEMLELETDSLYLCGYGIDNGSGWITEDSLPVVMNPAADDSILYITDDAFISGIKFVCNTATAGIAAVKKAGICANEYRKCVFDGNNTANNIWSSPNGGKFTVDSCDISRFNDRVIYSRIRDDVQTVSNNRIHDCRAASSGLLMFYPAGMHTVKQYITNNMFYNISQDIAVMFRQSRYFRVTGNLFFQCYGGIGYSYDTNENQQNMIAFNTVVRCTTQGIAVNTEAGAEDTVKYNISWDNTGNSFTCRRTDSMAVADYNWFEDNGNANWIPGANSDSGNAVFVNTSDPDGADNILGTADDGWALHTTSPCISRSDMGASAAALLGVATDITGAVRPFPVGSNLDLGAYEEQTVLDLTDWNGSRPLRFINGFVGTAQDSVTILVKLTPERIPYDSTHGNGADLRFIDHDNGTLLKHEVEVWDSMGVSYIWVMVPNITAGTPDSIFMYYDNAAASDVQDTNGTWDTHYKAVYHLNDDILDHTSSGYDAKNFGTRDTTGIIGDARYFRAASTEYMKLAPSTEFVPVADQPISVETWFNAASIDAGDNEDRFISIYDGSPSSCVILGVGDNDNVQVYIDGSGGTRDLTPTVSTGTWYYAAFSFDSTTGTMVGYVDGAAGGTYGGEDLNVGVSDSATLGTFAGTGNWYNGFLDELRISNVARSALYFEVQDSSMRDHLIDWGETARVDSVAYRSSGTDTTGDDTVFVYLNTNVAYAGLDTDAGDADQTFSHLGLGSMDNATLTTPNAADTNLLYILMTNADTILNHNRSRLALLDGVLTSLYGTPVPADTDSVVTYNVYLPRTGQAYTTLSGAGAAVIDDDNILVFDAGLYAETLGVAERFKLIGYGIDYPGNDSLPVLYDPGTLTDGWRYLLTPQDTRCSTWTFKFVSRTDSVMAVNLSTTGTDRRYYFNNCVFTGCGVARVCMERDWWRSSLTVDSCEVYGYTVYGIYIRHDDFGSNTGQFITNSVFHDIDDIALWLRDSRELVVTGNTFYDCGPSDGIVRFTACTDIDVSGNTIHDNTGNYGAIHFGWGCYDFTVTENTVYDNANNGGGIRIDSGRDGKILNNLVYNCDMGIVYTGGDSTYQLLTAFNTVVQCTSGGISVRSTVDDPDTVKYNIAWSNGSYDLQSTGASFVGDYNFYGPGGLDGWTTGTHTDSGYPLFSDTSGNDYTLQAASPCLGQSDVTAAEAAVMGVTTDLAGNTRPNPNATYADAGCYEEQASLPLWWNGNWIARRVLRIDNGFIGSELDSFTALVKLYSGNVDYSLTQDAGQDLRFVDGNSGVLMNHEIEQWDEAGTSYVWVRIPNIDNGSGVGSAADSLWMYYGNAACADGQDTAGAWAGDYVAVWHLNEGTGDHANATGGLTGSRNGNAGTTGFMGQGQYFDGNDYINLGDQAGLEFGGATDSVTFTAWVRNGTGSESHAILSKYNSSGMREYYFDLSSSNDLRIAMSEDGGVPMREDFTDDTVAVDTWAFVTATMDFANDAYLLYVDGALRAASDNGEAAITTMYAGGAEFHIGAVARSTTVPDAEMVGTIDEVRIASTVRTPLWIEAQDSSMRDNLFDFGPLEYNGTAAPQLDSAWYRSAGTYSTGDDTLYVQFTIPVEDDSLPTGAYGADSMFGILGIGGMDSATITTGAVTDDDMIVLTYRAGDTILNHDRDRLVLKPGYAYSLAGSAAVADTDSVVTYNVYNKNLGTSYETVREGLVNATADDTVYAFDNGYYTDTLDFGSEITASGLYVSNAGTNTPVIKAHDKFMDRTWQGDSLLLFTGSASTWYGFDFDGRFLNGTDSIRENIAFINPGGNEIILRKCSFHGAQGAAIASHASGDDIWTIDSCEFYNIGGTAVGWSGDTWASRVTNSVFRNCVTGIYIAGDSSLIAGNVFENCTYGLHPTYGGCFRNRIYNNLFYNCSNGIFGRTSNYNTRYNRIMFNTFYGNGIGYLGCSSVDSTDTVKYNVFWGNTQAMDTVAHTGTAVPVNEYNYYGPGNIGDWVVGAYNDSGYPVFVDTTDPDGADDVWGTVDDGLRLQTSSPCIDFSQLDSAGAAAYGIPADIAGTVRPSPAGTYLDAGCYEEATYVKMTVDSIKYWSCGTPDVADDSMFVWFNHNIEYDSLPGGGTGAAGNLFNVVGLGDLTNALIDTMDGQPDTNYIVVRMNAGGTIMSHCRSRLALRADSLYSRVGASPALADTDSVVTNNVYILSDNSAYTDINDAYTAAGAGDSVLVIDAGWYAEFMYVDKNIAFVGYGYGDSLPVWTGTAAQPYIVNLASAGACTVASFKFLVTNSGNDVFNLTDADPDNPLLVYGCEMDGNGIGDYAIVADGADDNDIVIDSNVIHGFGYCLSLNGNGSQTVSRNVVHDCGWDHTYLSAGVYSRGGSNISVLNNVFYDIKRAAAMEFDDTDGTRVTGNLVYGCRAGINVSLTNDGRQNRNSVYTFNTVVQCTTRGIRTFSELGSPDTVMYNICWSNGGGGDFDTAVSTVPGTEQRPVADYNYYLANGDWVAGSHSGSGYPYFIDTTDIDGADNVLGTADDGWALSDTSPCIGLSDVSAAGTDLAGTARPTGAPNWDLGAYENSGGAFKAKIYVSNSGNASWPYTSPTTATSDPVEAFRALSNQTGAVRDTILFHETGVYTSAVGCTISFSGVVVMVEPGEVCTLARDGASTDSSALINLGAWGGGSVNNCRMYDLALNGNATAGGGAVVHGTSSINNEFYGLDVFGLSNGGAPWRLAGIQFGVNTPSGKVIGCTFHDMASGRAGVQINGDMGSGRQVEIAGCEFYDIPGYPAIQFWNTQTHDLHAHHNLFYDCNVAIAGGINGTDTLLRDTVEYNTIYNCGTGIQLTGAGAAANYNVYRYNVLWGNTNDFASYGPANQWVFHHNCYESLPGGVTAGTGDVTSYPAWADTAAAGGRDFSLTAYSPCINASGSETAWYDKDSTATPVGLYNDLGCYENPSPPPRVDSVKYYSAGTAAAADDSMIVWFSDNLEFDSLPLGAGNADHAFTLAGLGDIRNATIDTPGGMPDTNFIFIEMNAGDTILCHDRSVLRLVADSVYSTVGVACLADTDSVVTYNVYLDGNTTSYRTVSAAYTAASAGDEIHVWDAGRYDGSYVIDKSVDFFGYGIDLGADWITGDSLPVFTNTAASAGTLMYFTNWASCTLSTFKFSDPDDENYVDMSGNNLDALFKKVVFDGQGAMGTGFDNGANDGYHVLDSCDFGDFTGNAFYTRNRTSVKIYHSRFHNAENGINATTSSADKNGYVFEGNIFWNCTNSGIFNRGVDYLNASGNLFYACDYGYYEWDNPDTTRLEFNTFVACTTAGLAIAGGADDTVRYNVAWHCGAAFTGGGALNDYNWYETGTNGTWTNGANADSGSHPAFTDTTNMPWGADGVWLTSDDAFIPTVRSPLVDASDVSAAGTDIRYVARPLPAGSGWDLGCYEEQTAVQLTVDSVHYYSAGTESWADDSLIVWFSDNLEFNSLPLGAGNADHAFSLAGMGYIANATIDTPGGMPDTNFIFIEMNAGDTIMSHLRSILSVNADSVYSSAGAPCLADTDSVLTYNVYHVGGNGYRTIHDAYDAAGASDSIMIFDAGLYPETLTVAKNMLFKGHAVGDSLPVWQSISTYDTLIHTTAQCTLISIKFHNAGDALWLVETGSVPNEAVYILNCEADGAGLGRSFVQSATGYNGNLTIDSCYIHDFPQWAVRQGDCRGLNTFRYNRIRHCGYQDYNDNGGLGFGYTWNVTVIGNVIWECGVATEPNYSGGIYFRNPSTQANLVIRNNLIHTCGSYGIRYYPFVAGEEGEGSVIEFNTVVGCTLGGISVRSDAVEPDTVRYNVLYGNNGNDLDTLATGTRPIADYNIYQALGAWVAGNNSINANAVFADTTDPDGADDTYRTADDGYMLLTNSPAVDASDITAAGTDIIGNTRPMPAGTYRDLGCYEEQTAQRLLIDSLKYWSLGTEACTDDSMIVWFSDNIEFDSLPGEGHGSGLADNMFDLIGLGDISTATVDTPVGCPDTNFIIVRMNAGDTVLNHNRSILALTPDSAYSAVGAPCLADTDSVTTYNVYVLSDNSAHRTINDAYNASSAGDSLLIMDAGLYAETLTVAKNIAVVGYGIDTGGVYNRLPEWRDPGSGTAVVKVNAACTLATIRFNRANTSCAIVDQNGGSVQNLLVKKCLFEPDVRVAGVNEACVSTYENDVVVVDSCIFRRAGFTILTRSTAYGRYSNNLFEQCNIGNNWAGTMHMYTTNNQDIVNNTFDRGCQSSSILLRDANACRIVGNVFKDCRAGITSWGTGVNDGNVIAFNTVVQCTTAGISTSSGAANPDTVKYNISWSNGGNDLDTVAGSTRPVSDYNVYQALGGWVAGANSNSAYPAFEDTANGDWRLRTSSPYIGMTDADAAVVAAFGAGTDLLRQVRPGPSGTNAEPGAYEEQSAVQLGIDSVKYWSAGTESWADDSMIVWFSDNIEFDSLPGEGHGSGLADNMFDLIGLGDISTATVDTPVGCPDTNFIIVRMNADDTILCHSRSILALTVDSAYSTVGSPCLADTDSVVTYNVHHLGGNSYRTITEAYVNAGAGDSLLIFDAGLYPDSLRIGRNTTIVGYGIDYGSADSLPVWLDPGTMTDGWGALCSLAAPCSVFNVKFVSRTDSVAVYAVETANPDDPYLFRGCEFDGTGSALRMFYGPIGYDGAGVVDSCVLHDFTWYGIYTYRNQNGGQRYTRNTMYGFNGGNAMPFYAQDCWNGFVLDSNTVYDCNGAYGAIRFTACDDWTARGNELYGIGSRRGAVLFDWGSDNFVFEHNIIRDCSADSGAICVWSGGGASIFQGRITNNLVYNCRWGINGVASTTDSTYGNYIAFNTIIQCTVGGIFLQTRANAPDTVRNNIIWSNAGNDLTRRGPQPVGDYNAYQGISGTWTPGGNSATAYPVFADTTDPDGTDNTAGTADDGFALQASSPYLDYSGYGTAGTDIAGQTRPMPAGSDWDLGCYEEQSAVQLGIDSVKYWSCGTESWADDSMIVWFSDNLEFDSLDMDAGDADNAFGETGLGYLANATIDTPAGCPDTNFVFIEMNAGDTVFSHLRSILTLTAGGIYSAVGAPCQADTDSVWTYNAYNMRTDSGYATVELALLASVDNDTVMVFDRGYYTDTLNFSESGTARTGVSAVLIGAAGLYPVIKNDGTGQTGHPAWQGLDIMVYADGENVEIRGFRLDGINLAQDDTAGTFLCFDRGVVASCSLQNAYAKFIDGGTCSFTDNVLYGIGLNWWTDTGGDISDNRISGCRSSNALYLYGAENTIVVNNFFYANDDASIVIQLRNARNNVIRNNLMYRNDAIAIFSSNEMSEHNRYIGNTIVNNTAGLQVDSASAVRNNILFGNTNYSIALRTTATTHKDSITYNYFDTTGAAMGDSLTGEGNVISTTYPLFSDTATVDFHLSLHSPCIDRGDTAAAYNDDDGGRCDMGAYGGPYALDTLMPPVLDTLVYVSSKTVGTDSLYWSRSPVADFRFYLVYRDTVEGFVPAESLCVDSVAVQGDTNWTITSGGKHWYYKVNCGDNDDYGGGYAAASGPELQLFKRAVVYGGKRAPGDTIEYRIFYDNDGQYATQDTAFIVDFVPQFTALIDTYGIAKSTGAPDLVVQWMSKGGIWSNTRPTARHDTVKALRWKIPPNVGAHSAVDDEAGADGVKGTVDTTQGTDSGWVRFRVRIR